MNTKSLWVMVGGLGLATLPSAFAGDEKLERLDADGDGRVTRAEYAGGSLSTFVKMDRDGDGSVTTEEISTAREKRASGIQLWDDDDKSSETIQQADQDGDGRITRAEHEAHVSAQFDALDENKDGVLTESELEVKQQGNR